MLVKLRETWEEFPTNFWALILATFIDRLGSNLIFPFFALYVTQRFNVGMTEVGYLFAIFSVMGFIGNIIGGALADRFGRRSIVIFSLVFSALSSITMGLVNQLWMLFGIAIFVGVLSDVGGPARQAMVVDLLPEEKRAQGFGLQRVVGNLTWIIGPTIGGFLAAKSYLLLFILDAISSVITALIVYRFIAETKPEAPEEGPPETILQTLTGYRRVFKDKLYLAFMAASMAMLLAYLQLYSTLSVFLRDVHGVSTQGFGFLMSMNATTVVLFQFWLTRRTEKYPPMLMMVVGAGLYLIGFGMYGFIGTFFLFAVAMFIVTVGEMIVIPVGQALVARFAPEDMRGRYMAIFGLSWTIPSAIGPWAAGLIMDNLDPRWVWYAAAIACAISMLGFLLLHIRARDRFMAEVQDETKAPAPA